MGKKNHSQITDEYSVKASLRELRNGNSRNYIPTESSYMDTQRSSAIGYNSQNNNQNLTEAHYDKLDNVKDKLNSEVNGLKDQIYLQGTEIRKELNDKFSILNEQKISSGLFWIVIPGLLAILCVFCGAIYSVSYSKLIEDNDSNKDSISVINVKFIKNNQIDKEQSEHIMNIERKLKIRN